MALKRKAEKWEVRAVVVGGLVVGKNCDLHEVESLESPGDSDR